MIRDRQAFGKEAESAAERLLRQKGYQVLDRNIRFSNGELDLVVTKANIVVFVEVKARRTSRYGGAPYAVDYRKERRLVQLALQYVAQRGLSHRQCRFDVVLCQGSPSSPQNMEHIENAFEVPGGDLRW